MLLLEGLQFKKESQVLGHRQEMMKDIIKRIKKDKDLYNLVLILSIILKDKNKENNYYKLFLNLKLTYNKKKERFKV
jgi:hypothetical protein